MFGFVNGVLIGNRVILAGGTATTLVDATDKSGIVVTGILMTNISGSSRTPVVDVYDGSTAYVVRDNAALADTASENVKLPGGDRGELRLRKGDLLRITSDTGVHVQVTYVDMTANNKT